MSPVRSLARARGASPQDLGEATSYGMTKNRVITVLFTLIVAVVAVLYFPADNGRQQAEIINTIQDTGIITNAQANLLPIADFDLADNLEEPVIGFKERITKKPFGIYITPETSPVQPDKFDGYHVGVDAEFTDVQENVPVMAVADGVILVRAHAPGYGGVVVVRHILNGVPVLGLYGHLDPASFLPVAISQVTAGSQIGILGDDHSEETDGARKHLHFSLQLDRDDEKIDFRGYVKTEEELSNWLNPIDFYR
ncbi:MAG: peptidoglycan DD-metalloendopeptidase family protein [Candidatus Taylorbacteria bacterium]|nr:peptidoglycan DD-metalloendopeptidase family protein [Candidatus Taylorbacteria bacterium]